jgi:hypothetical protein
LVPPAAEFWNWPGESQEAREGLDVTLLIKALPVFISNR